MKLLVLAGSILALSAGSAFAHDKPRSSFDKLDRNNDGYISRAEAAASPKLAKRFNRADKNDDGRLTRTEYGSIFPKKHVAKAPKDGFDAADKNHDGKLSRSEYLARGKRDVRTAKRNSDNASIGNSSAGTP